MKPRMCRLKMDGLLLAFQGRLKQLKHPMSMAEIGVGEGL